MSTSGTYAFSPSLGELTLYAYQLIQIRPTSLVQEHFFTARMAANLFTAEWSNRGVNLWRVDLVTVPLVEGQSTYDVDPSTIMMLDAYVTIDDDVSPPIDRIILPVTRTEYASYPNKEQQGFPTIFWFDRLIEPTVTIWPVPDGSSAQYLKYYRVRQMQDSTMTGGLTVDIPYRWFNAFANRLALECARTWQPSAIAALAPFATESYDIAAGQDVEDGSYFISPSIGAYYRN